MDVAILYSGGKDSTLAIEHCLSKEWNIRYLISIKPTRNDCYLFHFATVEHTKEIAKILGIKQIYATCTVADPKKEANIIREIVSKNPVDAVILGGTGLQETQIKSIRDSLFDLGTEVFATHTGEDHEKTLYDLLRRDYDIRITQVAAEGLGSDWLGKKIDLESFKELKRLSEKFGFHIGAEGGHYDTLVVDAPFFNKRLEIVDSEKIMENKYSGYLKINKLTAIDKRPIVRIR